MREALFAAAVAAAPAIGYTGAGTVEFLAGDDGTLLLPRDEHPAAGRAPRHRVHDRRRPRRLQIAVAEGGRLDRAAAAVGARHRGPPLRRGPGPDWQPHSGTLHTFDVPGVVAEFANPTAPGSASTPASYAGTWSASTTTRCSPR